MTRGKVVAIIGGQYGSEGKGAVAGNLMHDFDIHVRVGGPQAGHTFYDGNDKHVMQAIPCGWANRSAELIIGAGAVIDLEQITKELDRIEKDYDEGIRLRVFIDARATVVSDADVVEEGSGVGGDLWTRIGSTGKGVGAARRARIRRDKETPVRFVDYVNEHGPSGPFINMIMHDTAGYLNMQLERGKNILLEGAQGCALSMTFGPWPFVTSGDTGVAQLLADAGIPPKYLTTTIAVIRSWPIRVGGNSGPLPMETTWDVVSGHAGCEVIERTTVTKTIRRIARFDATQIANAARRNGFDEIAFTFADYLDGGVAKGAEYDQDLGIRALAMINNIEQACECPVTYVRWGPGESDYYERGEGDVFHA